MQIQILLTPVGGILPPLYNPCLYNCGLDVFELSFLLIDWLILNTYYLPLTWKETHSWLSWECLYVRECHKPNCNSTATLRFVKPNRYLLMLCTFRIDLLLDRLPSRAYNLPIAYAEKRWIHTSSLSECNKPDWNSNSALRFREPNRYLLLHRTPYCFLNFRNWIAAFITLKLEAVSILSTGHTSKSIKHQYLSIRTFLAV